MIGNFIKLCQARVSSINTLLNVNRFFQSSSMNRFENLGFSNTHLLSMRKKAQKENFPRVYICISSLFVKVYLKQFVRIPFV
jgi:hypothetical protein